MLLSNFDSEFLDYKEDIEKKPLKFIEPKNKFLDQMRNMEQNIVKYDYYFDNKNLWKFVIKDENKSKA